jgi:hypothetical protein
MAVQGADDKWRVFKKRTPSPNTVAPFSLEFVKGVPVFEFRS